MTRTVDPSANRGRCRGAVPICLAGALLLAQGGLPALAQAPVATGGLKIAEAVRTDDPISIDGRLDEEAWNAATVITDLHQILPVEYSEPSQRTEFLILYDDDALYLAARMYDDQPDRVVAKVLRQGGQSWLDDQFNIILDPFNDKRSGYRFQVNPNGVWEEGLFRGGDQMQWEWSGIWQAAATRNDQGWIAETRIPFKTVSFHPDNDTWGINLNRRIARNNESVGWVSRNRTQNPGISGEITGLVSLDQGLGLDIVPSVTANSRRRFSSGTENSEFEPSLDLFYKVTPALNASLTVNTDFSATEVDDRQVNLTRFGLFFPEQRDFFLQDADIFEFGRISQREQGSPFARPLAENARPFFSRTIGLSARGQPVDLEAGGKLSGRVGRWNVGALAIQQDEFESVQASNLFVGRLAANVLEESAVGLIVTDGDPQSNSDNSVAGIDFRYQNTRLPNGRTIESEVWYQQSETDGLDGDDGAWGARFWMPNNSGFRGGLGIKEVERNFNPALGYLNRGDIRDTTGEFGYTHRPIGNYVRSVHGGATVQRIERLTGGLQSEATRLQLNIENQTGDSLGFLAQRDKEGLVQPFEVSRGIVIPKGEYSFEFYGVGLTTGSHRRLVSLIRLGTGEFYDGNRKSGNLQLEWTPIPQFRALVAYNHFDIELPQGDFVRRLVRLGVDYIYSSKLSWVNLLQYSNDSEVAGINSRIHWIPQAGRELFVVLNHNLEDLDFDNEFHSSFADFSVQYRHTFRF